MTKQEFLKYNVLTFLIVLSKADITSPLSTSSSEPIKHFFIFNEVGQMAFSMTYKINDQTN